MKRFYNKLLILSLATAFIACSTEDDLVDEWVEINEVEVEAPSPGSLDLSNYVAVGNSLTAGFYDGALFPSGQANSYPAILAGQFARTGGGEFNNPNIISGETGTGRISLDLAAALAFLTTGEGSLADALVTGAANGLTGNTLSVNNFGVPGARAVDIGFAGYGSLNGFFGSFQSDPTTSVVADAAAANGSFFSLWIGNNDVLGYARAGGVSDTYDFADPSSITDSPINPLAPAAPVFTQAVTDALGALSAGGANGVLLTIPPVTTAPYFQAVTDLGGGAENLLPAGSIDAATATALNTAYGAYNGGLDALVAAGAVTEAEANRRKISFTADVPNSPVITDESLTDLSAFGLSSWRQASAANPLAGLGDIFPLDALFVLGVAQDEAGAVVPGITVPLDDQYTLTESEQINIITAVATYNGVLTALAGAFPNVTLVDLDPLFADVNGLTPEQATALGMSAAGVAAADGEFGTNVNGIDLIPISFDPSLLFNSLFSTDFIHPNPRGAALIVNEIISVLNATYDSEIPFVNPLDYEAINAPL